MLWPMLRSLGDRPQRPRLHLLHCAVRTAPSRAAAAQDPDMQGEAHLCKAMHRHDFHAQAWTLSAKQEHARCLPSFCSWASCPHLYRAGARNSVVKAEDGVPDQRGGASKDPAEF